MTVIHAVHQTPFKSARKADTLAFNAARFTPGTVPPILPYLNICNMIPDSTTNEYDPQTETHKIWDDWVFKGVVFYAHAEQEYHPDYANKLSWKRNRWTMHLLERSISTKMTRTILLEPTFNPQGQLHGFTMCLETAENAAAPMTWAIQNFKADAIKYTPPNGRSSRYLYHCELLSFLNHRVCQEDYMRLLPADRTGFFLHIVLVLIHIGVIDRSVREPLFNMVEETVWSTGNSVSHSPEPPATVCPSMIFTRR